MTARKPLNRAQRRALARGIQSGKVTPMYSHPKLAPIERRIFTRRPGLAARLFVAALVVGAGSSAVLAFLPHLR